MIFESQYAPGMEVTIYKDAETEREPMGKARLREYRSTGLPFILNESRNEIDQKTYVLEEWMIEWLMVDYKLITKTPWLFREDRPHKLKRLQKIGI